MSSSNSACPRCRTTQYQNPQMKLLVNICGHFLCSECMELLFIKGSGACPSCNVPLRRNDFRLQLFQDPVVEKEIDIRKRVFKDFNLREEDFNCLDFYNDYLELRETLVHNMVHGIDVAETRRKMEEFRKKNEKIIAVNRIKVPRWVEELDNIISEEKSRDSMRRDEMVRESRAEKEKKTNARNEIINELMTSDLSAADIVERAQTKAATLFNVPSDTSSSHPGTSSTAAAVPRLMTHDDSGEEFMYSPFVVDIIGPQPPAIDLYDSLGYTVAMTMPPDTSKWEAAGYNKPIAITKYLQVAFCNLYSSTSTSISDSGDTEQAQLNNTTLPTQQATTAVS